MGLVQTENERCIRRLESLTFKANAICVQIQIQLQIGIHLKRVCAICVLCVFDKDLKRNNEDRI